VLLESIRVFIKSKKDKHKRADIDKPQNLAKSVAVE